MESNRHSLNDVCSVSEYSKLEHSRLGTVARVIFKHVQHCPERNVECAERYFTHLCRRRYPHVVTVYDVDTQSSTCCFYTEYPDKGDIISYIKRNGLTWSSLVNITRGVLKGAAFLESIYSHLPVRIQVNPDNVWMFAPETAKVAFCVFPEQPFLGAELSEGTPQITTLPKLFSETSSFGWTLKTLMEFVTGLDTLSTFPEIFKHLISLCFSTENEKVPSFTDLLEYFNNHFPPTCFTVWDISIHNAQLPKALRWTLFEGEVYVKKSLPPETEDATATNNENENAVGIEIDSIKNEPAFSDDTNIHQELSCGDDAHEVFGKLSCEHSGNSPSFSYDSAALKEACLSDSWETPSIIEDRDDSYLWDEDVFSEDDDIQGSYHGDETDQDLFSEDEIGQFSCSGEEVGRDSCSEDEIGQSFCSEDEIVQGSCSEDEIGQGFCSEDETGQGSCWEDEIGQGSCSEDETRKGFYSGCPFDPNSMNTDQLDRPIDTGENDLLCGSPDANTESPCSLDIIDDRRLSDIMLNALTVNHKQLIQTPKHDTSYKTGDDAQCRVVALQRSNRHMPFTWIKLGPCAMMSSIDISMDYKQDIILLLGDIDRLTHSLPKESYLKYYKQCLINCLSKIDRKDFKTSAFSNIDPNKNVFPVSVYIRQNPDCLRPWLENWKPFDTSLPATGSAWNVLPCLGEDSSPPISPPPWYGEWEPFDLDIDGEVAWDTLTPNVIAQDEVTDQQLQIIFARENRKHFVDDKSMSRRRLRLASYFQTKYHFDKTVLNSYLKFASLLEESQQELNCLAEYDFCFIVK